jgi:hypothetical protein
VVAVITAAETITAIVVIGEDSAAVDRAAIHKDRAVRIRAKICSIRVSKMAKSSRRKRSEPQPTGGRGLSEPDEGTAYAPVILSEGDV